MHNIDVLAEASTYFPLLCEHITIEAAEGKPSSLNGTAYTGGELRVGKYPNPVVIDLNGLDVSAPVSILADHDRTRVIGQAQLTIEAGQVPIAGRLTGDSEDRKRIEAHARDGFMWPLSIGVSPTALQEVAAGQKVVVNNRTFTGPITVVRRGRAIETSVLSVGADNGAFAAIAAAFDFEPFLKRDNNMNEFQKFLASMHLVEASLSPEQLTGLQATFARMQGSGSGNGSGTGDQPSSVDQVLAAARAREARHAAYGRVIEAAMDRGMDTDTASRLVEAAQRDDLSETDFELAVLRATRATPGNGVASRSSAVTQDVVEAALAKSAGMDIEAAYSAEMAERVDREYRNGLSLCEMLIMSCRRNGYHNVSHRDIRAMLEGAFPRVQASVSGPSTYNVGGLLSNIANKFIRQAFLAVESSWRQIASVRSVTDLKTNTIFALSGNLEYELISHAGELKHGTVSEDKWTVKADTYGKIFSIDEDSLINDDLGAFNRIRQMLGRGSALSMNKVIWNTYLAGVGTHWTAARKNLFTGAATALSIDSLTRARTAFSKLTDPDGEPLGATPTLLIVPTELEIFAGQLANDPEIRITNADTTYSIRNPHTGRFTVASSQYLNHPAVKGGDPDRWWIQASPDEFETLSVAFLNGQASPRVEEGRPSFDQLGIVLRGVHRMGCALGEYRATIEMRGK